MSLHLRYVPLVHAPLTSSGNKQFPCPVAHCGVTVHCAASESAEEHDVVYPVVFSYGTNLLHAFYVHGESLTL